MPADSTPQRQPPGQTLLFDADDTLWENSVYFEHAISAFIAFLDHRTHSADQVRACLHRVERTAIATHGYGLDGFRYALLTCFEQLTGEPITAAQHARIVRFAQPIADRPIEPMPGVVATLAELAKRHRCLLVTKGDPTEQRGKLARSGLAEYFSAVEVLPEKDTAAYRALALRHGCPSPCTWMVGNSPKSDINPALAAGLHAVFLPHKFTWALEKEAVSGPAAGRHLLVLPVFADLTRHF